MFDINGDGLVELVDSSSGTSWKVYANTGSGFSTTYESWPSTGLQSQYIANSYGSSPVLGYARMIDMNGDNLPDRVVYEASTEGVLKIVAS
jgi:hypothetical protein